jgi:competence protein ComEA
MKLKALFLAVSLLFSGMAWSQTVSVNTATVEELVSLERIGKAYAERIIEEREANGPFADAEDLVGRVSGIGPAFIDANEGRLAFDGSP